MKYFFDLESFKIDFPLILLQLLMATTLLATAFAAPGAPAPYAPEKLPPQPYKYEYGVDDHYNGFVADVTYEGTPVYPPEPKKGYHRTGRAYKPAAVPPYKPAPVRAYRHSSFRGYIPGFNLPY